MSRTILIGDIHGCYDELVALLDAVALAPEDRLVSVGDLVDRGPKPREVVELFRRRPNTVVLCGNHERKHVRGVLSYSQLVTREQLGETYAETVAWFATLPYFYEDEAVRAVHWGHFPGVPLDEVPEDVLAGTTSGEARLRERYGETPWYSHYVDAKPIVFGHAVVGSEPLVLGGTVFGLDTGACHGQRLTALVLPERRVVSVPAAADHWAEVSARWQGAVLRATPWAEMTFEQIARKVAKLRGGEHAEAQLDVVAGWAESVRAALPTLADHLDAAVLRVLAEAGEADFGRRAAEHPAASHLLRMRAGRLGRATLGCATPAQVFELASRLGVTLPCAAGP